VVVHESVNTQGRDAEGFAPCKVAGNRNRDAEMGMSVEKERQTESQTERERESM
jgi:hypothetical protein